MKILVENTDIKTIPHDCIVLDIETTGFSAINNMITILGYIMYDEDEHNFNFHQYFAESIEDEKILLLNLVQSIKESHKILTFNGMRFDIPFIEKRFEYHNIEFSLKDIYQIDLYVYLKNNKIFTDIPATNQKQLELLMGLKRPFKMDGRIAVDHYKEYLRTGNPELYQKMSLYNKLDVLYLAELFVIYYNVENKKTIEINHHDNIYNIIIQTLVKSNDKYTIDLISNKKIFNYEVEDIKTHYKLNAYSKSLTIELHTISGLVSETKEGICFNTEELLLKKTPNSTYNLKKDYMIIEDEDEYYIDNIKEILNSIIKKAIENFLF
ncbi:ribonuclease H-like domain-containing protein [Microaceticoccus formicicus]|uniref:ribonuclease H-like domain-containing protein n=1 Tax=Microaceticoccus formicicus TaxID=3118105 RepID=UPI003CD04547|nr:ribonuclease H-like domain-containing protein [Peptoniphilaceae bacterium AMB_02]